MSAATDPPGGGPKTAPEPLVGLSSAAVYPESTATAFEVAAELGYDALEVMVGVDPASQDSAELRRLSERHQVPVCSVHAPCLLITQRVWGTEPWGKLERSAEMAHDLGADVVVVHPPFRWQREYAQGFAEGVADLERRTGIGFAVENMYPWRASRTELQAYLPSWDPTDQPYANTTLDLSHTAVSRSDPIAMARALGARLRHVHLTDGTDSGRDEHLVPGRGTQPCGELLEYLAGAGFGGHVVVEISTRRSASREVDLVESLAFTRLHFAAPRFLGAPEAAPRQEADSR